MRNALNTQPRCALSIWNSLPISTPAIEMLVRSMNATVLSTSTHSTSR